jgi:uncharacterized protein (TIGR03437 family)
MSRFWVCLLAALSAVTQAGAQGSGFETSPLTGPALRNVIAFTRLLGYVQYFHPSDQASAIDWEAFTVYALPQAEAAQTPADLANTLQNLFGPVAPTVLVYPTGQTPQIPPALKPSDFTGLSVTRWAYLGFPSTIQSPYSASRISQPVPNGVIPAGFTDPASAYTADLGAGVSCFVPVDLYQNSQGTLPQPTAVLPSLPGPPWQVSARAVRLGIMVHAWNVPQHFSPYFDVVNTDWGQALANALTAAAISPDEPSFYTAFRQLGAAMHDGHVSGNSGRVTTTDVLYVPPLAWDWIEGSLVATFVADSQGQDIKAGDAIVSIDGQAPFDLLAAAESLISSASQQWSRYEGLIDVGAGPYGSTAQMQIESGGNLHNVAMTRTIWTSPWLWEPLGAVPEPRPQAIAELDPGIWYVDVSRAANADWNTALANLQSASGIIFDYRGYPQFFPLDNLTATDSPGLRYLIPTPLLPDRTGMTFQSSGLELYPIQPFLPAKLVFLTDGRAISQAETNMGTVADVHLGEIVGGPTAGTDGNVTSFNLFGLYYLGFTGMKVLNADGSQYHGIGAPPTVPVMRTRAGVAAGIDEVLARGLALLQNPGVRPIGPWVSSAASYLPESASPGAMLCIFAPAVGPSSSATMTLNAAGLVDTTLNDTQVLFDGVPAPLTYVGPTQVNLIVPYELAGKTHSQMTVEYKGQQVLSLGVAILPSAPAIFAMDYSGIGPGAILNQDGSLNSAGNPADRGSVIQIFATGEGVTDPAGVDGKLGADPLPHPVLPVSVRIGGIDADAISAAGGSGLVAGVLLVNARIPAGVAPGQAAVFLTIGSASSQPGITVSVR